MSWRSELIQVGDISRRNGKALAGTRCLVTAFVFFVTCNGGIISDFSFHVKFWLVFLCNRYHLEMTIWELFRFVF